MDKCDTNPSFTNDKVEVQKLENIGSCDRAYLSYIIDNYNNLPDTVYFTKGSSNGSVPPRLTCKPICSIWSSIFKKEPEVMNFSLDSWQFTNNPSQEFEYQPSGFRNMGEWVDATEGLSRDMYRDARCDYPMQGMFQTTRDKIRNVPKSTYENLYAQQHSANEEVDHFIERSWGPMFCHRKR